MGGEDTETFDGSLIIAEKITHDFDWEGSSFSNHPSLAEGRVPLREVVVVKLDSKPAFMHA